MLEYTPVSDREKENTGIIRIIFVLIESIESTQIIELPKKRCSRCIDTNFTNEVNFMTEELLTSMDRNTSLYLDQYPSASYTA
jgi:hypothetical protein